MEDETIAEIIKVSIFSIKIFVAIIIVIIIAVLVCSKRQKSKTSKSLVGNVFGKINTYRKKALMK